MLCNNSSAVCDWDKLAIDGVCRMIVECWTNSRYCLSRLRDAGKMCCARLVTNSLCLRANTLLTYCEANRQVPFNYWRNVITQLSLHRYVVSFSAGNVQNACMQRWIYCINGGINVFIMKLGGLNFRLCVLIHFAYNILTPSTGVMSLVQASSVACHTTVVKHRHSCLHLFFTSSSCWSHLLSHWLVLSAKPATSCIFLS